MKCIDIDCIQNANHATIANQWIAQSCELKKEEDGRRTLRPTEAIYWISTRDRKPSILKDKGLIPIGNFMFYKSITEALMELISQVDKAAVAHGMSATGEFRRPVQVLTDREFNDIGALKATPLPTWVLGIMNERMN